MERENPKESSLEEILLMSKVGVKWKYENRIVQGSIFKDAECIEYVVEKDGVIEVGKIQFPLVLVLTQDCDLAQDSQSKSKSEESKDDDKRLLSVLVAPLYNAEHIFDGNHLESLSMKMQRIDSKRKHVLKGNQTPRYHYLEFPEGLPIVPQVIDFKHYLSLSLPYLEKLASTNFVCQVSELYREDISHRFASYLSRIGLPDLAS